MSPPPGAEGAAAAAPPSGPWAGLGAVRRLGWLRLRGATRHFLRSLRQPKRLALLVFGLALVSFWVWSTTQGDGNGLFGNPETRQLFPVFLTFFLVTTTLASLANGALVFTPPEVQLLFPAPIGTRTLILSHLVSASLKSISGALVFSLFLRPAETPWWRAIAGYGLLFETLVLLALVVDLAHLRVPHRQRVRRTWAAGIGVLLLAGLTVLLSYRQHGRWDDDVFVPLGLPARPWADVLIAEDPVLALAGCLAIAGLLTWLCLRTRVPIRERSGETSQRMQDKLARLSKGTMIPDARTLDTGGRLVPRLPHWGGAGPHAWRQLSILRRKRKALLMMVAFAAFMGAMITFSGNEPAPLKGGFAMLAMLLFMGPFYVQCDFRSDYDNLAWLRSLPTPPTALAAGQLLASTGVLYAIQVLMTIWAVPLSPDGSWPYWLAAYLLLPFLDGLQLCVENAVYLFFPTRLAGKHGPPGALAIFRMYALMLGKMVLLAVCLGLAALPGLGIGWVTGSTALGLIVGGLTLALETCLCVALVGRIFRRVDPSRDLGE